MTEHNDPPVDRGRHSADLPDGPDSLPTTALPTASESAENSAAAESEGWFDSVAAPDTDAADSRHRSSAPTRRPIGSKIALAAGETLITAGLVLLLFVVYELYVTDIFSARKQAEATTQMEKSWETANATATEVKVVNGVPVAPDPGTRKPNYDTSLGGGFARMYIPAFGADWAYTVIEGTDPEELTIGPGHYEQTQYPGQKGNFAVAGHRVSKGAPFNDLDAMNSCDAIVVETQDAWYVYRVLPMQDQAANFDPASNPKCKDVPKPEGKYANVFGRIITQPNDGARVFPVPGGSSTNVADDDRALITLTTCHPQFSDRERMIIHGVLTASYGKMSGFVPPELKEG